MSRASAVESGGRKPLKPETCGALLLNHRKENYVKTKNNR
jgi:hypothetical protein